MTITPSTQINGIGLVGKRRAGKDTSLNLMRQSCKKFVRVSFADALKQDVCSAYGVSMGYLERNKSNPVVRTTLQAWGERAKEMYGDSYWINRVRKQVNSLIAEGQLPVVIDVRFPHEADYCRSAGLALIKIQGIEQDDGMGKHASEMHIDTIETDFVIDNHIHMIGHLRVQIDKILAQLCGSTDFRNRLLDLNT